MPYVDNILDDALCAWRQGDAQAAARVIDLVYDDFKQLARRRLDQLDRDGTFSPTELLHETLVLALDRPMKFENRAHLMAGMSLMIRSALVDHVRARGALKRGGMAVRVTLAETDEATEPLIGELLQIEQALSALEKLDPRCGRVMHLACFAALDRQGIADVLQVSLATVDRDMAFARGFIAKALHDGR